LVANHASLSQISHLPPPNGGTDNLPEASLRNLNLLSFLVADMNTAFGPFVPVALTEAGWSPGAIGYVLGAGGLAALAGQLPAGALIDATHHKRIIAAIAVVALAAAALVIAWTPLHGPVLGALLVQGLAGVVLGPTIAVLTLTLSSKAALGERLGRNVRSQALGASGAAVVLGVLGRHFGPRSVFLAAAALAVPALLAVRGLRPADIESAPARTQHAACSRKPPETRRAPYHLLGDRRLQAFALCVGLFFLGNAAILTLAADGFAAADPRMAEILVPGAIIVPQLLVALLSPRLGRLAQAWGRRPVLLLGFAAVPLRALLFALGGPPILLVAYQALDGIGGAAFGVMLPLVVADLTRANGRFNLAYAGLGLAGTAGTALSNGLAGAVASVAGTTYAFLALAAAGVLAMCAVGFVMPETRDAAAGT
jgi:MFS family permease